VAVVRHALGALGETLEVDSRTLSDIKLAITEACTNVVVHAYDDEEGPMEVAASVDPGTVLEVVVRDNGPGITPRADSPGLGLGLPLIATLTESVELSRNQKDQTEVRMIFRLDGFEGQAERPAAERAAGKPPAGEPSA
jgi:anti-sigma regulatory factor (Ser/Thr protein kinase)